MKFLILSVFCVIASFSLAEGRDSKLVLVADKLGALKYVDIYEEPPKVTPLSDPQEDVVFLLFTRANPLIPQILQWNQMGTVAGSNWSATRSTIVIAHGWLSNSTTEVNPLVTAAYLAVDDVNVIVVDWSVGAGSLNYITSRNRVGETGRHVGDFFANMLAAGHIPNFSRVTCAGQSLGAHVCGHFGKRVIALGIGILHTIFGLDPAGPLFSVADPTDRLDAGDAEYVENSHTDTVALGIGDPIGHCDHYPNGGTNMPGCLTAVCDHAIAANFFAESVTSPAFWGRRCANLAAMLADQCTGDGYSMGGYPSNHRISLRGIFRMPTNPESPFGFGPF